MDVSERTGSRDHSPTNEGEVVVSEEGERRDLRVPRREETRGSIGGKRPDLHAHLRGPDLGAQGRRGCNLEFLL